jgi:hypothetical protein
MPDTRTKVIASHRRRMREKGFVRVEVQARKDDAILLRQVAGALADPHQASEVRALLRERFGPPAAKGLKALLANAPLEGIDLDRSHDTGRTLVL